MKQFLTIKKNRQFEIDFDKIQSIQDVIEVLKAMNIGVVWYQDECPEQFKIIKEKGFLKEVIQ